MIIVTVKRSFCSVIKFCIVFSTSHLGQNHGLFGERWVEGLLESSANPKSSHLPMKRPQTLPISTNIGLTERTNFSHGSYSPKCNPPLCQCSVLNRIFRLFKLTGSIRIRHPTIPCVLGCQCGDA